MVLEYGKEQYKKEQNELLQTVLNYRFLYPWRGVEELHGEYSLLGDTALELYLTNTCNQKCEYCYLVKHPELYPAECNNPETILKNLSIIYNYITINHLRIPTFDLFSGEIWQSKLGYDVLNLTLEYVKKGMYCTYIQIAANCSFVDDNVALTKIQWFIDEFQKYGTQLQFSISIDGKYIDNQDRTRKDESKIYTDDFYDKIFSFARHNRFYFHPMVSPHNVHLWKENYKWWMEMLDKYGLDRFEYLMLLEVRDSEWDDESIAAYNDFNKMLFFDLYDNVFLSNPRYLADTLLGYPRSDFRDALSDKGGYYPCLITKRDTFHGCSIASSLIIRVGDLAICPCHRTAYSKYLYGKLLTDGNTITGIEANNPQMAIHVLMSNTKLGEVGCDSCVIRHVCLGGCLGSQLETMQDPFVPIPSVCKFFMEKYRFLFQLYLELGIYDILKEVHPQEVQYNRAQFYIQIFDNFLNGGNCCGVGTCTDNISSGSCC